MWLHCCGSPNSVEEKGMISESEKIDFITDIDTITSDLKRDYRNLNKKKFIQKYGHLRPSTYDILSKNYEEGFKYYFEKFW